MVLITLPIYTTPVTNPLKPFKTLPIYTTPVTNPLKPFKTLPNYNPKSSPIYTLSFLPMVPPSIMFKKFRFKKSQNRIFIIF